MQIEFQQVDVTEVEADTLLVGLFEGEPLPDPLQDVLGAISDEVLSDFKGAAGDEVALVYSQGALAAKRLLVVGLGKRDSWTVEGVRRAVAKGIARAKSFGGRVALALDGWQSEGVSRAEVANAASEAATLTLYEYSLPSKRRTRRAASASRPSCCSARTRPPSARRGAAKRLRPACSAARDLVNAPPNIADAPFLAHTARQIADSSPHISCDRLLAGREARTMGMGAFAGVGQGSSTPPQFIVLEYRVDELAGQRPVGNSPARG